MRPALVPALLVLVLPLSGCEGDDGKASPKDAVTSGCHAFTAIADSRDAARVAARKTLATARSALSTGATPVALRALASAEDAATAAEVAYATSPDVSLVAIAFAADADTTYQPLLTAFLSGDVAKAKAACSPY